MSWLEVLLAEALVVGSDLGVSVLALGWIKQLSLAGLQKLRTFQGSGALYSLWTNYAMLSISKEWDFAHCDA